MSGELNKNALCNIKSNIMKLASRRIIIAIYFPMMSNVLENSTYAYIIHGAEDVECVSFIVFNFVKTSNMFLVWQKT